MSLNNERKGEVIIFFELLIWSLFPIVAVISYTTMPSIVSLFWSTLISAFFFIAVTAYRGSWKDFKNPLLWKYSAIATFFIGIVFYGLYYYGLTMTTPGNGSIIALFEVFTSFLFFNLLKGEKISMNRKIGALFIVLGAAIVLLPSFSGINKGDFIILLATFFAPVGNYFTQKARKIASTENILFLRSLIAAPFLVGLVYLLKMPIGFSDISSSIMILLLNGLIIFGLSKILWVEAINYISVTKAIALSSTAPLVTLILSWIMLGQMPTIWQVSAVVPMIFGVLLLTSKK